MVHPEGFTSHSRVDSTREVQFAVPIGPRQPPHGFGPGIVLMDFGSGLSAFRGKASYPVHQGDEGAAPISGPDGPTTIKKQPLTDPNHRNPASATRPTAPDDDRFAAVFAAARETVSSGLDLNAVPDEPVVTGEDADVGHRRTGS